MSITGALSRRRAIQIVASAASLALVTGLRGALAAARAFGEATGGAFDPTVQPLWTLYATHFAASAARPEGPDGSAIDKAIALVDYRNLSLTTSRVAFERRGMGITLNGIAQGYITDRVADLLRNEGLDDVLVDLGEIRGLGHHADGRPWTVGLKDPLEPARIVDTLTLENRALASSAGSATRFDARGRHHHLFDPPSVRSAFRREQQSLSRHHRDRTDRNHCGRPLDRIREHGRGRSEEGAAIFSLRDCSHYDERG